MLSVISNAIISEVVISKVIIGIVVCIEAAKIIKHG
jgi:hypothetical protein